MGQQLATCRRQLDAVRGPVDDRSPEAAFEGGDPPAEPGLGDLERAGRPGEVAFARQDRERHEQFHSEREQPRIERIGRIERVGHVRSAEEADDRPWEHHMTNVSCRWNMVNSIPLSHQP